jgi:hypothetical protein
VSPRTIRSLIKDPAQPQAHIAVLKLALRKFLKEDFPLLLLKSTKIKQRSKLDQMKKGRELLEMLFEQ